MTEGYGYHGFPGFGQGIFRKGYYNFILDCILDTEDEVIQMDLAEWFCDAFRRDSDMFKTDLFMNKVRNKVRPSVAEKTTFQQRHYYYFARLIKDDPDAHRREFIMSWLSNIFGYNNPRFKPNKWREFCLVDSD